MIEGTDRKEAKKDSDAKGLKEFNLKVGDIVVGKEEELHVSARYEVIGVYCNVFRCKKISGQGKWLVCFAKKDYQIGEVQKV